MLSEGYISGRTFNFDPLFVAEPPRDMILILHKLLMDGFNNVDK